MNKNDFYEIIQSSLLIFDGISLNELIGTYGFKPINALEGRNIAIKYNPNLIKATISLEKPTIPIVKEVVTNNINLNEKEEKEKFFKELASFDF